MNERRQDLLKSVPSFARGLPILLVDRDPTSLASTKSLLEQYSYKVKGTEKPSVALSTVQDDQRDWFKLVLANIDGINEKDSLIFRELMKEKIPVILMSAYRHKSKAGRYLADGASYFLYKPICPENLRVLWQHAFRRRTILPMEKRHARWVNSKGKKVLGEEHSPNKKIDQVATTQKASTDQLRKKTGRKAEGDQVDERCTKKNKVGKSRFAPLNVMGKGTTIGASAKRSNDGKDDEREYQRPRTDSARVGFKGKNVSEEERSTDHTKDHGIGTSSSSRRLMRQIVWYPELHRKFTAALSALGDDARPKTILQMMDTPHLTLRQVSSHFQKYKAQVQRLLNITNASNVPSDGKSGSSNKRVETQQQPDTQDPVSGQVGQASIESRSRGYADFGQKYFLPNPQLSFDDSSQIPNQVPQQAQNQCQQLSDFLTNPTEPSSHSSHCEKVHNGSQASSHTLNYPEEQSNFSDDNLSVNQGLNENEGSIRHVPRTDLPNMHSINPLADPTAFTSQSLPSRVDNSLVLPSSEPVSSLQNQTMPLTAVTGNAAPTVPLQVEVEDDIFTGLPEIFRTPREQHLWTTLCNSSDLMDLQHHTEFDSILNEVDTPFVLPEIGRETDYYAEFASLVCPQGTGDNLVPSQANQYKAMNQGLNQSLAGNNIVPSQENQFDVMNQGVNLVAEVEPQPQVWSMKQSLTSEYPAHSQEDQYNVTNQGVDLESEVELQPQAWLMNQSLISDNLMPSQENQPCVMNQELNHEVEPYPKAWFMNQALTSDNPVTCQENQCPVMSQGLDLVAEGESQPQAWLTNQSPTGNNLVPSPENQNQVMYQGLNPEVEPHLDAWFVNQTLASNIPVTCQESHSHVMNQGPDLTAEAEPQPQACFMNQSPTGNSLLPSTEIQHYLMNQGLNLQVEPQPEAWFTNQSQTGESPVVCQENQCHIMNQELDLEPEVEPQPQASFMNHVMNGGLNIEGEPQPEAWFMNQTLTGNNPVTSQDNRSFLMNQGWNPVAGVELQPQPQAGFMNQPQSDYNAPLMTDGLDDLQYLFDDPMLDEIHQFSEYLEDILQADDIPIIE